MVRQFISVAPFIPLDKVLTYAVSDTREVSVEAGMRVVVPVGRRRVTGIVTAVGIRPDIKKVREIFEVVDAAPAITPDLLKLTRWMADYYLCSWGEALKCILPAAMNIRTTKKVNLLRQDNSEQIAPLKLQQRRIIEELKKSAKPLSVEAIGRRVGKDDLTYHLAFLEKEKWIKFSWVTGEQAAGVKYERTVRVNRDRLDEALKEKLERSAPKQFECISLLAPHTKPIPVSDLYVKGVTYAVIKALEEKELVTVGSQEAMRNPLAVIDGLERKVFDLTDEQKETHDRIAAAMDKGEFAPFLVHGVTGSGKTEVYIRLVQKALAEKGSAVVLVPEIALTPQMIRIFKGAFGNTVAVIHSRISAGEKFDVWRRLQQGVLRVVIGPRSALFAPVKNLRLIIVDEEQETSYKQFDTLPRYHARDTALVRARLNGAVCVLGSATPALESYHNAREGKYTLCSLHNRIGGIPMPRVTVVDMRAERKTNNWGIFSRALTDEMNRVLAKGEQVILLQNRRGFSAFLRCHDCGFIFECKNCKVTMPYHKNGLQLLCHYCGYQVKAPDVCPACAGENIKFRGTGTEKIEEELKKLLPGVPVTRMDTDTTTGKWSHYELLEKFRKGESKILLGTQMIAKGLDFPNVTCTGVISADIGLNMPDFRAEERTFQLLTQIAGRTGRGDLPGQVIVQSYSPEEHSITCAAGHDYGKFFAREIEIRRGYGYPPFVRLGMIRFSGAREDRVKKAAMAWQARLVQAVNTGRAPGIIILGPVPSALERIKKQYRWQIAIKSPSSGPLHQALRDAAEDLARFDRQVGVAVDIDPVDML